MSSNFGVLNHSTFGQGSTAAAKSARPSAQGSSRPPLPAGSSRILGSERSRDPGARPVRSLRRSLRQRLVTSSQRDDRRLHIVHIITDLYGAGAEDDAYKVLAHMDRTQFTAEVITLAGGTAVRKLIEAIDIPVQSLDLPPSLTSGPSGLWRLGRILNERPGALVQTWMYHADMLGGLSTLLAQRQPVLWDIQGSALDAATTPWTTRGVIKACAKLSWRLPRRIVCCGHTARRVHVELGYDGNRMVVIPNAVDVSQFKPDATARQDLRRELGLGHDEVVLGMAARFNPQKDHATLVRALALLRTKRRVDFSGDPMRNQRH